MTAYVSAHQEEYGNFAQQKAAMELRGVGPPLPLYARSGWSVDDIIAQLDVIGSDARAIGNVRLDRLADSPSTTSTEAGALNTVNVNDNSIFTVGDFISVRDISPVPDAYLGYHREVTALDNPNPGDVTFNGAAITFGIGDVLIKENDFSDTVLASEIVRDAVNSSDGGCFIDGGLVLGAETGDDIYVDLNLWPDDIAPTAGQVINAWFVGTIYNVGAGADSFAGFGFSSASGVKHLAAGAFNHAGTWKSGFSSSFKIAPAFGIGSAYTGPPGDGVALTGVAEAFHQGGNLGGNLYSRKTQTTLAAQDGAAAILASNQASSIYYTTDMGAAVAHVACTAAGRLGLKITSCGLLVVERA
jgi:hypothetical protein